MNSVDKIQVLQQRIKIQELAIATEHWMSCLGCEWWDEKGETCTQFKRRPPAKVIAVGCQGYQPSIPF